MGLARRGIRTGITISYSIRTFVAQNPQPLGIANPFIKRSFHVDPGTPRCRRHRGCTLAGGDLHPAEADTRTFAVAAGDSGGSADITTVKVANGSGGGRRIAVRAHVGDLRSYDVFNVWLDTDREDPGPEYRVRFIADDDPPDLSKVERLSDAGDTVPCPGLRFEADPLGPDEVAVSVPRKCSVSLGPSGSRCGPPLRTASTTSATSPQPSAHSSARSSPEESTRTDRERTSTGLATRRDCVQYLARWRRTRVRAGRGHGRAMSTFGHDRYRTRWLTLGGAFCNVWDVATGGVRGSGDPRRRTTSTHRG